MKMRGSAACLGLAWLGVLAFLPSQTMAVSDAGAERDIALRSLANAVSGFTPEDGRGAPGFDVVQTTPTERQKPAPANAAKMPPKPSAHALTMKPADVAARYMLERAGGKDADCLLILDNQTKAPGGYKASLAPGCRDEGIMIFDPVGWRLVADRLVLTARRGYTTHFDLQPDGTWRKDASEGKPLILKKL
jgi:Protease inhibitor Inh